MSQRYLVTTGDTVIHPSSSLSSQMGCLLRYHQISFRSDTHWEKKKHSVKAESDVLTGISPLHPVILIVPRNGADSLITASLIRLQSPPGSKDSGSGAPILGLSPSLSPVTSAKSFNLLEYLLKVQKSDCAIVLFTIASVCTALPGFPLVNQVLSSRAFKNHNKCWILWYETDQEVADLLKPRACE